VAHIHHVIFIAQLSISAFFPVIDRPNNGQPVCTRAATASPPFESHIMASSMDFKFGAEETLALHQMPDVMFLYIFIHVTLSSLMLPRNVREEVAS